LHEIVMRLKVGVMATEKKYWTQYASHPADLDELVNERLAEGWEPYGAAYVAAAADPEKDVLFCQPMVKTSPGQTRSVRVGGL
jgi:hypothetical protein